MGRSRTLAQPAAVAPPGESGNASIGKPSTSHPACLSSNPKTLDVLSARVGNYQYGIHLGMLIWVAAR